MGHGGQSVEGGVPRRPTSGPGSRQQGGTAARPVYSAVGLCRSRGRRGCVQGLINHGCLGRDKQSRPSRDAAAPATGGRGRGVVSQRTRWTRTPGKWGSGGGYTITLAVWSTSAWLHGLVNPHSRSGRMQTSTRSKCMNPGPFPLRAHV